jgi:exosortase
MTGEGLRGFWKWLPALMLWLLLCWHLSHHWSADPQYSFGWLVPALSAYLAWARWNTRPAPGKPLLSGTVLFAGVAAALFLPVWLVAQPNPDWRLVSWAFAGLVVLFSMSCCAMAGGVPWMTHFAVPTAFILTAIPWPSSVEIAVIQGLTGFVSTLAVEILNLTGTLAVQRGHLIEVGTGVLGVDEACSGIRSVQAALMLGIFLGEMMRLSGKSRAGLVGAAIVTAIFGNVVRASWLAHSAATSGLSSVDRWHDSAGYSIVSACLLVTWLLGLKLSPPSSPAAAPHGQRRPNPLPTAFAAATGVWLFACVIGTEWWFRASTDTITQLVFSPPADAQEITTIPVSDASKEKLKFDDHQAITWREPSGERWVAYTFQWNAGPARSRILARMHRPDICLSAVGHRLVADRGEQVVEAGGIRLPFQGYSFTSGAGTLEVYHGLWENRAKATAADQAGLGSLAGTLRAASLRAVLDRERYLAQQVIELALFDYPTTADADAALRKRLPLLLRSEARSAR